MENDYNSVEILWNICQDFKEETDIKKDYLEYISALLYIAYFKKKDNIKMLYSIRNNYYIADEIDLLIKEIQNENGNIFSNIKFKDIRIHRNIGEENIISKTIKNLYELISKFEGEESKKHIAEAYEKIIIKAISNWEVTLRKGEVYTPTGISKVMSKITVEKEDVEIYDPFCGTGNILLHTPKNEKTLLYGKEENLVAYNLCMTNLFLHDINNSKIEVDEGPFSFTEKKYDYIISNPPFIERSLRNKMIHNQKYGPMLAPGDYAYVLSMFNALKENGKMAVILPHGVLFREIEKVVREKFIEENYIDAIIGLPENIFLGTRNSVIIMVLKKNKADKNILFIDASNEYQSKRKINILNTENQEKIINTYLKREEIEEFSHLATISEIAKNDYKLTIKRYVTKHVEKQKIKKEEILENLEKLEKEKNILEEHISDVLERLQIKNTFKTNNDFRDNIIDYEILGQRITNALRKRQCSLWTMFRQLDIPMPVLIAVINGRTRVHVDTLAKICKFLDVSIDDMIKK